MFIRTKYNDKGELHRECRCWEKKGDKQIILHKNMKYISYIQLAGFTSLLNNKNTHTHQKGWEY